MQRREGIWLICRVLSYLLEYCVYVEERSKDVKEVGDRLRSKIMESFGYLYENLDKEV